MGIHRVMRHEIARAVRNAILRDEYLPGEKIPMEAICKRLEVSPTPVQDAMLILEQEGLVLIRPHSGVYVRTFTQEEIVDLAVVEVATESIAVRRAARNITVSQISELKGLQKKFTDLPQPTDKEFRAYDRKFHSTIIRCARSKVLEDLLEKQFPQIYLTRYYTASAPGRIDHARQEHSEILDCMIQKKADKAVAALKRHIQNAMRDFLENQDLQLEF